MSNSSWRMQLAQSLTSPAPRSSNSAKSKCLRTVILGIGNELNGDDAAGIEVIRRLRMILNKSPDLLLLEGGAAPENVTAPIRRYAPEMVLLVDCAAMESKPGSIAWLNMADIDGLSASTHTLPLSVLAGFLQAELGCKIGLIGIQPESLEFGKPLSAQVDRAVAEIVTEILSLYE